MQGFWEALPHFSPQFAAGFIFFSDCSLRTVPRRRILCSSASSVRIKDERKFARPEAVLFIAIR